MKLNVSRLVNDEIPRISQFQVHNFRSILRTQTIGKARILVEHHEDAAHPSEYNHDGHPVEELLGEDESRQIETVFDNGSGDQQLERQRGQVVVKEERVLDEKVRQKVEDVAEQQNFAGGAELVPRLSVNVKALPALSQHVEDQQTAVNGQRYRRRIPNENVSQQVNLCL